MSRSSLMVLGLVTLSLLAAPTGGCHDTSDDAAAGDSEVNAASRELDEELRLLAGSEADLARLTAILDQRIATLSQAKDAAKVQAEKDIASYSERQWSRSWYRKDERAALVNARARD